MIRLTPMLPSLREPAPAERVAARREVLAAFGLAVLASSALCAAAWLLARW